MKDDELYDVRQLRIRDGRCFCRTNGGGGGRRGTVGDSGKQLKTAADDGGRRGATEDDTISTTLSTALGGWAASLKSKR